MARQQALLDEQTEKLAACEAKRMELHGCLVEMAAGLKAHRQHVGAVKALQASKEKAAAAERAQLERENAGLAHTVHRLHAEAAAGAMGLEPSHHREPAAAAGAAAAKLPLPLKAASEASANSPSTKAARPKTAGAKAAAAARAGRGKKKEGGGGQIVLAELPPRVARASINDSRYFISSREDGSSHTLIVQRILVGRARRAAAARVTSARQ